MALISKRTVRKWAKPLTEKQLTFSGTESVAESGNTVTVKIRGAAEASGYAITESTIIFKTGAIWLDGSTLPLVGGVAVGADWPLAFNDSDKRPKVIYAQVNFIHHGEFNKILVEVPLPEVDYEIERYTPTRPIPDPGVNGGAATYGLIEEDDFLGSVDDIPFNNAALVMNTTTDAVIEHGFLLKPVARMEWIPPELPHVPEGFWTAYDWPATGDSPSKLVFFNMNDIDTTDGSIEMGNNTLTLF